MDWNAIQQYLPLYQKAAVLTVRLGVAGIIFAIIIGLACAVIQYDKVPVLRQIVGVYIQLSRNTPLLVQLFIIFYGLPSLGIMLDAFPAAVIAFAFNEGEHPHQCRDLRHCRSGVSGRQLHGRSVPQRSGSH